MELRLRGDDVAFVTLEAERLAVTPDEIGRRALALYTVLIGHLEAGNQVLLRLAQDDEELPDLIRLDAYASPRLPASEPGPLLDVATRVRSGVVPWPPMERHH